MATSAAWNGLVPMQQKPQFSADTTDLPPFLAARRGMVARDPLEERNPKWLQDDYVKFIRWGSWRIERSGAGILAFITNHGYLDNPTFRGMRQQLMETFDEIYIRDLHGNTKKREVAPDGSKDGNVFDIQQGVAICLMVKLPARAAASGVPQ